MELPSKSSENTINTASGNEKFDYDNIREKFNQKLSKCCSKKVDLMKPCWIEGVNHIIKEIEDAKLVKNEPELETFASRAMEIYDVLNKDEKQLLILKEKNENGENIVVIPNEECFDLLAKIHLENDHADERTMMHLIRKKYLIRAENVSLFLELCNICYPSKQMCQGKTNKAYYFFIMNFNNFIDAPYTYLLILVEMNTGFFHLRPLVLKDASEVAIELYKIFSDYGPPSALLIPDKEPPPPGFTVGLLASVNTIISKMCLDFFFDVIQIDVSEIQKYDELVKNELCEWISMTGCGTWATGCRMVQWKINNIETDGTSPYEALFGYRPNDSLYLNPVWLRISDSRDENIFRLVEKFKKVFNLNSEERSQAESIIEQSQESEAAGSEDDSHKCVICLHPVYRSSFCHTCSKPMHDFCGTRYVGIKKTVYSLCMKCKNMQ